MELFDGQTRNMQALKGKNDQADFTDQIGASIQTGNDIGDVPS